MIPKLVIESLTLFRRIIKSIPLVHTIEEATKTLLSVLVQAMVPVLTTVLLFGRETASTNGYCEVGRALEDLQLAYHGANFLRDLHARSARANDGYALILQINTYGLS